MSLTKTLTFDESADDAVNLTYGERIILVLEQQKRSKAWLAGEIGISKQAMNYLLNHTSKKKFVNEISLALGVNPEWLKTGKGKIILSDIHNDDIKRLPIIPMSGVPNFASKSEQQFPTVVASPALPKEAFAIILENTSMEPLFNQGTILIFDPTIKPKSGDYVIFSIKQTGDVFFRQLFIDGSDIYLKSVDTMYRNIENEDVIFHGVLVESRNKFK